jgi:lysozyme
MQISDKGLRLIKHFESCRLKAYRCSAGVLTIGWGHTGPDVKPGMQITMQRADELLAIDVRRFVEDVNSLLRVNVTQAQFDALVSFAYNLGSDIDADTIAEGLGDSTLLRKLNAGDFLGAAAEFPKWNKAGGKVLNGLTKRRLVEQKLFATGELVLPS